MKTLAILTASAALALAGMPAAAAYVFTPTAASATAEGVANDGVFQRTDTHQQWLFDASIFGSDPVQIDGVSFRFDSAFSNQFTNSGTFDVGSAFKVTLATLAGPFSTTFAENLSGGRTVLSGTQDIPFVVGAPVGQTKPWGVQLTFTHPYVYDPAQGGLVFDIVVPGQNNFGTFDATRAPLEHLLFARDAVSATGALQTLGPIVRFDVEPPPAASASVPEPASWTLMIVGFGATGELLRRRRLARPA